MSKSIWYSVNKSEIIQLRLVLWYLILRKATDSYKITIYTFKDKDIPVYKKYMEEYKRDNIKKVISKIANIIIEDRY